MSNIVFRSPCLSAEIYFIRRNGSPSINNTIIKNVDLVWILVLKSIHFSQTYSKLKSRLFLETHWTC